MKKVLITGQRGLLGSACVRHFSIKHDVHTSGQCDLSEPHSTLGVIDSIRPDIIINCAAKVGGVKANRDYPVDFMLQNLAIQNNVIEAAHAVRVPILIHVATSCMFPKDAQLPVREESLFTGPFEDSVEAYAIAKVCGWRLCKAYWQQYERRYMTVCPSNIYGIGDTYSQHAHVIPSLIRRFHEAVIGKKSLEVWGDGSALREFIYADDVAAAIETVIEKWNSPEPINIGTGIGTSISDLVGAIALTSPHEDWPKIAWNTDQPTGIPKKTFSVEKITSLGWKPQFSLERGLLLTWQDFMRGTPRGLKAFQTL